MKEVVFKMTKMSDKNTRKMTVITGFASIFTIHILYHKMSRSQHKTNKNKQI
jgi:hypothetical protein